MYGYDPFIGYSPTNFWFDKKPIKNTGSKQRIKKCLKRHGLDYETICGIVRLLSSWGISYENLDVCGGEYYENFHKSNELFELLKFFQINLISSEYKNGLPFLSMEFYGRNTLLPKTKTAIVMQNLDGTFDDVTGLYETDLKVHRRKTTF